MVSDGRRARGRGPRDKGSPGVKAMTIDDGNDYLGALAKHSGLNCSRDPTTPQPVERVESLSRHPPTGNGGKGEAPTKTRHIKLAGRRVRLRPGPPCASRRGRLVEGPAGHRRYG